MRSCGEPTWRRVDTDEYTNRAVRSAWLAWQEAERQMIERCAKVCEADESGRDGGGYYAEVIRALGAEDD